MYTVTGRYVSVQGFTFAWTRSAKIVKAYIHSIYIQDELSQLEQLQSI